MQVKQASIHGVCLLGVLFLMGNRGCDDDVPNAGTPGTAGTPASGTGGTSGTAAVNAGDGASTPGGAGQPSTSGAGATYNAGASATGTAGTSQGGSAAAGSSAGPDDGDDAGVTDPEAGASGTGGAGGAGGAGGTSAGTAGVAAGGGGESAPTGRCGTRGGVTCADDQFCNFEPDADCGGTDRGGQCQAIHEVCTLIYKPVCGCDNHTYASACSAHGAGISAKREGLCDPDECKQAGGRAVYSNGASTPECASDEQGWTISGGIEEVRCCVKVEPTPRGKTCGGIAALQCQSDEFCNYEAAAGGQGCGGMIADAAGVCEAAPQGCTRDYTPVCGCDHLTYNNRCEAHTAGSSVLHDGACTDSDCAAIGGKVRYGIGPGPECLAGETEHGYVIGDNGSIPIEGALCCLP